MKKTDAKSGDIFWFLDRQNKTAAIFLSFVLISAIGIAEYSIGIGFSFSFFDVIPVFIIAGVAGPWLVSASAFLCTGIWILAATLQGWRYPHEYMFLWNGFFRLGIFLAVGYLTLQLKEALRYQTIQAHTDHLTGAANGRLFHEALQAEIDRSKRYKRPFTLAYIDVDDFKTINDRYGHERGDAVLRAIASILMRNVRKADVVGRLGGDEFGLLLVECDDLDARTAIRKIKNGIDAELTELSWPVTLSIGALTISEAKGNRTDLMKAADDLMYSVKKSGKNDARFSAGN
jgi:diguanylate cyclase (GGDEF)-like protein